MWPRQGRPRRAGAGKVVARCDYSSARREGGCKFNAVELDGRPKKIALIADGFNSFQPTVGQKRSVTVKAMGFYGIAAGAHAVPGETGAHAWFGPTHAVVRCKPNQMTNLVESMQSCPLGPGAIAYASNTDLRSATPAGRARAGYSGGDAGNRERVWKVGQQRRMDGEW